MKPATPKTRDLAQRIITFEESQVDGDERDLAAALCACEKLRIHLSKLVGTAGFQALVARALVLSKREFDWLEIVNVKPDGSLENLNEAAKQYPSQKVAEGSALLLMHLFGLLVTFIGEDLTFRLVGDVWPQERTSRENSNSEETRS